MELDIGIIDTNGEIPCQPHSIIWAYRRNRAEKGSKVVCKIPALKGMCTENPDVHLTNYDWFFVIDTNTNLFKSKSISVSCVLGGRAASSPGESDSYDLSYIPVLFYEFWDQPGKPEPFAWKLLVHDLANDPLATTADKVAIVVDSELGNVEKINKRTANLANGMELPDNYHLIYASADARDFAINKIFRHCDRQARHFFTGLKAQYTEVGFPEVRPGMPFLRTWEFENGIRRRVLAYESSIKLGEAFQP
jgi:hypothetical protein